MHENYDSPVHLAHDIELLKLKTPATLGAVWGSYASQTWPVPDTGWRRLSSSGSQPYTLQEASVIAISDDVYKSVNETDVIHKSMICAGGLG